MGRVRATIVVVEKQWLYYTNCVCIYSLRYPACNLHGLYYHLWPATIYNICPPYLINGTIFGKKKSCWKWNVFFWVSIQLLS